MKINLHNIFPIQVFYVNKYLVFDRNGDGCIDKEEFLKGLAMCCRGPIDEDLFFPCVI